MKKIAIGLLAVLATFAILCPIGFFVSALMGTNLKFAVTDIFISLLIGGGTLFFFTLTGVALYLIGDYIIPDDE